MDLPALLRMLHPDWPASRIAAEARQIRAEREMAASEEAG